MARRRACVHVSRRDCRGHRAGRPGSDRLSLLPLASSDADTDILADYVLALLNADAPEAELEKVRLRTAIIVHVSSLKADLACSSPSLGRRLRRSCTSSSQTFSKIVSRDHGLADLTVLCV